MRHGSLDGSEAWGRTDTCICMAESLHCSETITTLFVNQLHPIYNKKLRKKKKEDLMFPLQQAQVRSLVDVLRFNMPAWHGQKIHTHTNIYV